MADTYLPDDFAVLFPDNVSGPFWERCAREELAFQRCADCGTFRHPPAPICHRCRSPRTEWAPVSGEGTVYSYTVVTHPVHPLLAERVPFNVVLVEFADAPGVRLVSNVVDAAPEDVTVGMSVRLHWERVSPDVALPRFVTGQPAV